MDQVTYLTVLTNLDKFHTIFGNLTPNFDLFVQGYEDISSIFQFYPIFFIVHDM